MLLLSRCGTLVSGDSTGSVQFWDSRHGTLLQAHTRHKGDVNALATVPSQNRVFSAGSDGQVGSTNKQLFGGLTNLVEHPSLSHTKKNKTCTYADHVVFFRFC